MFQVGDTVVCGSNGVCRVESIGPIAIMGKAGKDKKYYTLVPYFDNDGRVFLPVESERSSMRYILTKEDVAVLMSEIDKLDQLTITDEKMREAEYRDAVNSSDPRRLIRAIKTMYCRRKARMEKGKKSTAMDERYIKLAEKRLYEEMSLVLEIEAEEARNNVMAYIEC